MCLAAIALDHHPRFPLVVASNRDEFFHRAAAPLAWWRPRPEGPAVLGGRDLAAGGTWLGLTAEGRLGLLTNIREPARHDPAAPTRGALVTDWLCRDLPGVDAGAWPQPRERGHNGFNLILLDLPRGGRWWASNRAGAVQPLGAGVHGVSNALLDTPWPKLRRLKAALGAALAEAGDAHALAQALWPVLADTTVAADDELPRTGIPLERERALSPAFIRTMTPQGLYGTRCSTLVIGERLDAAAPQRLRLHVIERRFDEAGHAAADVAVMLEGWPLQAPASAPQPG